MAVRIEKILCTVLHEAHEWQVEVTMQTLSERSEGRSYSQDLTARVPDVVAPEPDGVGGDTATDTSMR
jgi:hypothetical protein